MESILEPSAIIKTGYETGTILTPDGKVYVGLVMEDGESLRLHRAAESRASSFPADSPGYRTATPIADRCERSVRKISQRGSAGST